MRGTLSMQARMNAAARHSDSLTDTDERSVEQHRNRRVRFELIFASLWLAFGLFLLPALIFSVGSALLGTYGENAGLSTFYIDFFGDLADGSGRAWSIALGPLVLIYLIRAIFIGVKSVPAKRARIEEDEEPRSLPPRRASVKEASKRPAGRPVRVEPRMSND